MSDVDVAFILNSAFVLSIFEFGFYFAFELELVVEFGFVFGFDVEFVVGLEFGFVFDLFFVRARVTGRFRFRVRYRV